MRLTGSECRERFAGARVARLATADLHGRPHLVPVTFALAGEDRLVTAVDQKPKATTNLRRLRNIAENPAVSVLCDHYDDDWTGLWWVRVDGRAEIVHGGAEHADAVALLAAKYPQYQADPPGGPVIVVHVGSWTGWAFSTGGRTHDE